MFYNRQHFQESGMAYPDNTWTWDREIPDALHRLRRVDGENNVLRYGLVMENRPWTAFFSQGGEVFTADGTASALHDSSEAGQLFAEFYRWRQDNLIPNLANHRPTFARGEGAIHGVMGTFAFPFYAANADGIDWGIVLPPQGVAGLGIDENVNGWGISSFSQHKDEAWMVLKALASVNGKTTMQVLGHFSPVLGKTDEESIQFMQDEFALDWEEIDLAFQAINYVRPRFRHPEAAAITSIAQGAFGDIALRGAAPGPTLENASQRINAILRGEN